jgi:hypothetical protein
LEKGCWDLSDRKNCYLANVNSDCLSNEVIGIDQDIHNDVTSCNETTGLLDGNSNLYRNCINSDKNTINSPKKEEKKNNNNYKFLFFTDVRLNKHLTEPQDLQSSLFLFYQNIWGLNSEELIHRCSSVANSIKPHYDV